MVLIISTLSFLYTTLDFNHSFDFSYLSLAAFLNHDKKTPHFSSSSSFQHQEK
jgi:hypothetical protein